MSVLHFRENLSTKDVEMCLKNELNIHPQRSFPSFNTDNIYIIFFSSAFVRKVVNRRKKNGDRIAKTSFAVVCSNKQRCPLFLSNIIHY